jgi:protein involved in polysaccharide export with SLBB domain
VGRVKLLFWLGLSGLLLPIGCGSHRLALERALLLPSENAPVRDLDGHYVVRCPDVLMIHAPQRPEASGEREIGPSGCISLFPGAEVEVAGLSVQEASQAIARRLGSDVQCRVSQFNSQQIFLIDPRGATQRSVPYRGPETVVEFLRRVGGLEGADLDEVTVVRAHVAEGRAPEVFTVDLEAILLKKDAQTDIRLAPFDRLYLAQTSRWRLHRCLPPWMRTLADRLHGPRLSPARHAPTPLTPPPLTSAPLAGTLGPG